MNHPTTDNFKNWWCLWDIKFILSVSSVFLDQCEKIRRSSWDNIYKGPLEQLSKAFWVSVSLYDNQE